MKRRAVIKAVDAEVHGDPDNPSIDTRRYLALRINCALISKIARAFRNVGLVTYLTRPTC